MQFPGPVHQEGRWRRYVAQAIDQGAHLRGQLAQRPQPLRQVCLLRELLLSTGQAAAQSIQQHLDSIRSCGILQVGTGRLPLLLEQPERIHETGQGSRSRSRFVQLLQQSLFQGQQAGEQVAAIDRGDVTRGQHLQRGRVVPVQEMPPVPGQARQRLQRVLDALEQLGQREIAQVMGRQGGEQVQPDIGGRGPMGHFPFGSFLEIVRRQEVVLRGDELFKEAPGLACRQAECLPLLLVQLLHLDLPRQTHPPGHQG